MEEGGKEKQIRALQARWKDRGRDKGGVNLSGGVDGKGMWRSKGEEEEEVER